MDALVVKQIFFDETEISICYFVFSLILFQKKKLLHRVRTIEKKASDSIIRIQIQYIRIIILVK